MLLAPSAFLFTARPILLKRVCSSRLPRSSSPRALYYSSACAPRAFRVPLHRAPYITLAPATYFTHFFSTLYTLYFSRIYTKCLNHKPHLHKPYPHPFECSNHACFNELIGSFCGYQSLGSITNRSVREMSGTKIGLERAAEIEPNRSTDYVKEKEQKNDSIRTPKQDQKKKYLTSNRRRMYWCAQKDPWQASPFSRFICGNES